MKNIFQKIKEEKLTPDEKAKMLSVLKDFVKKTPIEISSVKKTIKSPFYLPIFNTIKQRKFAIPTAFLLIFILTTSTTFGAMNSLPGDILYPVKIFNENVKSAVAVGAKAKARVSTEQAISRLEEAERLAKRGNLTPEKAEEIKIKFEEHSDEIKKNIEDLKKEGNSDFAKEVSSHFKDSIGSQKEKINKLTDEDRISTSSRESFSDITSDVEKEIKNEDDKEEIKMENNKNSRVFEKDNQNRSDKIIERENHENED